MHDSPPQLPLARRAAQYVRMSTEHQQYSTANQADKILDYAAHHGFEIVRTYADEGKSGLIPSLPDQNLFAHSRSPMDMMRHGWVRTAVEKFATVAAG